MSFLEPYADAIGLPVHREEETDADRQIVRRHGRPQGDHLHQRCRGRPERTSTVHRCDSEHTVGRRPVKCEAGFLVIDSLSSGVEIGLFSERNLATK
jgi:hypothetical protein